MENECIVKVFMVNGSIDLSVFTHTDIFLYEALASGLMTKIIDLINYADSHSSNHFLKWEKSTFTMNWINMDISF